MLQKYKKQLRALKTEKYSYGVSNWLGHESLASASIRPAANIQFSEVSICGAVISFYATGLEIGCNPFYLDYSTATRSDCAELLIEVISSGQQSQSDDGFLDDTGALYADSELFDNAELYS